MTKATEEELLARDKEAWVRGDTITVGDLAIVPKRDFGPRGFLIDGVEWKHGWLVLDKGENNLPGATWGKTRDEALMLGHTWIAADRNAERFWALLRAMQYMTGKIRTI